ncbi:unnamed protein product [Candida verbasci]|uniref:Glycoside hydrolase family 76 protein n=1 Tax=Candida verbasci TaxID=1227364 RepID=A0A9W4U058_9ASCO|nr:unnamed protein product [Candida verbasci]
MFVFLLFILNIVFAIPSYKRDLSFDAQHEYTNTIDIIWDSFWNHQQQAISAHSSCSNGSFSSAVIWDLAVAAKPIIDSGNVARTNLIMNNLYNYQNIIGWFAATPDSSQIYTDDNAQVLWAYLDAYELTHNTRYLTTAIQIMTLLQTQWSQRGGILWQVDASYIASISTTEAALSAVRLYEYTHDSNLLTFATNCIDWMNANLRDPSDGFYYDGIGSANGSTPNKGKLTYTVGTVISTYTYLAKYNMLPNALSSAITLATNSLTSNTFLTNGFWNNQVQYIHLLFAGFGDLIKIGGQTSFINQVNDQGNYYYQMNPVSYNLPCQGGGQGTLLYDGSMAQIFYQLSRINS